MTIKKRFIIGLALLAALCAGGLFNSRAESLSDCSPITYEYHEGRVGKHVAIVCSTKDKSSAFDYGFYCKNTDPLCSYAATVKKFGGLMWEKDPISKLSSLATTSYDCKAPPAEYQALCAEYNEFVRANWAMWTKDFVPVKYVWKVKPNGTATTRPSIDLATNKDGPRAPVGALCLPDKPQGAKSGADIRAQWVGGPDGVVTICQKQ